MSTAFDDLVLSDLKEGILSPLLGKVKSDDTLMLAVRSRTLDIYYRGGCILHLGKNSDKSYEAKFDWAYAKNDDSINKTLGLPIKILEATHAVQWTNGFKHLKELMDAHFSEGAKSEREFQQLVAWENNRSRIAGGTEYFITDIEYAVRDPALKLDARVDMLGVKWPAADRKKALRCQPVLIEMKYGDDALDGKSGIVKHIKDIAQLIAIKRNDLSDQIRKQFNDLTALGLLNYNKSETRPPLTMNKPEVVFILANHTPRGTKLSKILDQIPPTLNQINNRDDFDLRFFVASSAGYALHESCMLDLEKYRELVERKSERLTTESFS
jgi:hypothetical protein